MSLVIFKRLGIPVGYFKHAHIDRAHSLKLFFGASCCTVALLAGCSSVDTTIKPRQEALKQTELGNYQQAEAILVPLVKTMELKKSKTLANATQQLAWVFMLDGKFKDAKELAFKAKYDHEQQEKKDVDSQILDDYTLATIFTKIGDYPQAEPLIREAIELRRGTLKPGAPLPEEKIVEAPRLASLELGLGTLEFESGRYQQAEKHLQDAVKLAESDAAENKSHVVEKKSNIIEKIRSDVEKKLSDIEKKPNASDSDVIEKNSDATEVLAEALEQVALVYQANGKYNDAEAVCKRGMRMIRDSVGMQRPSFIFAANNLMSIYSDQHKYTKVDLLVKAIWARENSILREGHPEILRSKFLNMTSLSHIHSEVPPSEIQSVYNRLIDNYAQLYGADNPHIVAVYQAAGEYELSTDDYQQAETSLRAALTIARQKLEPKHPRTIAILNSLSMTLGFKYLATKNVADLKEAKKLVREAISKEDDALPADNPIRARSLGILGSLFAIDDDNEGAYRTFHQYLEASKKANYEDPSERLRFLKNYQSVLAKLGYNTEAERFQKLATGPAHSGQPNPEFADSFN